MTTHKQDLSKLSINQLSLISGVSYNTIKRRLAGLDSVDQDGKTLYYLTRDALAKIYHQSDEDPRDRLDRLRGDKAELELAQARGELISLETVGEAWLKITADVRSQLLGLPSKLAAIVAPESDPAKIRVLLEAEIEEALEELSRFNTHEVG